jgi:phospholipid/cholesterol/gamma-HCH transport system substrate-binding protein
MGVVAVATILVAAILVLMIGSFSSILQGTYQLDVSFDEAPGVSKGTPVRKFGIRIGEVSNVGFAKDRAGAIVTVKINDDVEIKDNETLRIDRGVLGDAVLEVIEATHPEKNEPELKKGEVRPDPLAIVANIEGDLARALRSLANTSDDIGELATRVNDLLGNNEEQVVRIVNKMEKTIDRLSSTVASMDDLLSDPVLKENLKRSISALPEVLTDAREAISGLKTALSGVDRNLANLEGFTRPLGERGNELVANIEGTLAKLDKVMGDLSAFSEGLNNSEGSLGMLMNNPDVYQQLNEAATRINGLTKQFEPILNDTRVFTDKLARHGLNGVLKRDTGTKRTGSELGLEYHPGTRFPTFLRKND